MCLFTHTSVFADDACTIAGESDPLICGSSSGDEEIELMDRTSNVLNVVYLWIGIIAVIFIVIGGIKYMTAASDSTKVQGAKKTITFSVVGLVVVLAAFAITNFFIGALDGRTPDSAPVADEGETILGDKDRYKVRSITSINSTKLIAGQSGIIKARVIPDYAKNKTLTYKSSNPDIVSVDNKGNIKAKKAGNATITIESPDGVKKEVKVSIIKPVPVETIKLSTTKVKIEKGKTVTVTATATPNNAADKTLTWKSANKKIATVTQNGKIKGIKDGETTVEVSAFNQEVFADANNVTLAAVKKSKLGTTITKKIKVTVTSDPYETVGDQRNVKYNKRLDFRKETRKIINKHTKDFFYNDYQSTIKKYGGYTQYVKDLGGVFKLFANEDKIKVKTAADFQAAVEYVWGLWTIWGVDYGNGGGGLTHHNWGGSTGSSDGFYVGQPGRSTMYSYDESGINDVLRESKTVRTNCNKSVSTFSRSTSLKTYGFSQGKKLAEISKVGRIEYVDELQVGDLLEFNTSGGNWHHTAMVGEVYKDYVVAYEGGPLFMISKKFKKLIPRSHTKKLTGTYGGEPGWYGVRVWDIDQSKTLKGLNE